MQSDPPTTSVPEGWDTTEPQGRIQRVIERVVRLDDLPSWLAGLPKEARQTAENYFHQVSGGRPEFKLRVLYCPLPPEFKALVGCRISILWPDDGIYYRGEITGWERGEFNILYDDGESESLNLLKESFKWLTPRGASAGAGEVRKFQAMFTLKARNVPRFSLPEPPPSPSTAPAGSKAVGHRILLRSPGCERQYDGEVMVYDAHHNQHLVLFNDGEHENLNLRGEEIVWLGSANTQIASATLEGWGEQMGCQAIGLEVPVFVNGKDFRKATVTGYSRRTGKHEITYSGGTMAPVAVKTYAIEWLLAPQLEVSRVAVPGDERHGMADPPRKYQGDGTKGSVVMYPEDLQDVPLTPLTPASQPVLRPHPAASQPVLRPHPAAPPRRPSTRTERDRKVNKM